MRSDSNGASSRATDRHTTAWNARQSSMRLRERRENTMIWDQFAARFGPKTDMLGFAPAAQPSAREWLVTFTDDFMAHADATHSTAALMSGLRFFTPEFVSEIALPLPAHERTI